MLAASTEALQPADMEQLWANDEDSFEVKVPDFHFDWGVKQSAEKKNNEDKYRLESTSTRFTSLSIAESLHNNQKAHRQASPTPPPAPASKGFDTSHSTPPPRHSQSARSSLSSVHVASLTDASTASASSMVPTPPIAGPSSSARSVSSHTDASEQGESAGSGRMYGGARRFQRVVSAPITRRRAEEDEALSTNMGETSTMSASTSHTATMRPTLVHIASGSTVPTELTSKSHFMTPSVTDRTLTSTARLTGRRLGGLSKFGGPARRVIPAQDSEEAAEEAEQRNSPVLIASPERDLDPQVRSTADHHRTRSSPPLRDFSTSSSTHAPHASTSSLIARPLPRPDLEPLTEHAPLPSHFDRELKPGHSRFDHIHSASSQPPEDEPFRPFGRQWEQENRPIHRASNILTSKDPARVDTDRLATQSTRSTHASQPEPPSVERISPSHDLRAERPAPLAESRFPTQSINTAPLTAPAAVPQHSASDAPQPTAAHAQIPNTTRTSYIVNGVPYERLQRLGKGGSSTVYSVLYSAPPKKRVIYALKVVQLDRADSETYQSYTNEIELLKRLRGHDRVIQLIDHQITFSQPNRPHRLLMVMECGEIDFAALLDEQKGKAINMNFVGLYWEQAVQAVHQENVVHTDLKPANFVLVKGRLKIIDFGIAKAVANDTVNIQRDQQIGTVNYMSPEAIQRMNNQKVLKLSYPSDVWSLGCILYQMIYGNPPFQHIGGGPLGKMSVIADPNHAISYPETAIPKTAVGVGLDGQPLDPNSLAVAVSPAAIDSMKRCLAYRKEHRLTIPELLHHEFLKPKIRAPDLPPGSTPITQFQMERLVNFVLKQAGLSELTEDNHTAEDLFSQLQAQNALSH